MLEPASFRPPPACSPIATRSTAEASATADGAADVVRATASGCEGCCACSHALATSDGGCACTPPSTASERTVPRGAAGARATAGCSHTRCLKTPNATPTDNIHINRHKDGTRTVDAATTAGDTSATRPPNLHVARVRTAIGALRDSVRNGRAMLARHQDRQRLVLQHLR